MNEAEVKELFNFLKWFVPTCISAATVVIVWIYKHYKERRIDLKEMRADLPVIKRLENQQKKIISDLNQLAENRRTDKNEMYEKIIETKMDMMRFMETTFNILSKKINT